MKLSINLFTTFDGVSQGPGSPGEDTRNGFSRGGWLMPVFDQGSGEVVNRWYEKCGALLLGRRTFDTFPLDWPKVSDPEQTSTADRINNNHKYAITSTSIRANVVRHEHRVRREFSR